MSERVQTYGRNRSHETHGTDRLPPHSIEAEQGVLGCVLLEPAECLAEAQGCFGAAGWLVFYDVRHQGIYRGMEALAGSGRAIDVITVKQWLREQQFAPEGGEASAYLAGLPDRTPSAANLAYYLEIVWEKYLLRKAIATCTALASRAMEDKGEAERLLEEIKSDIAAIGSTRRVTTPRYLQTPADFQDEFFQLFFGATAEEPGLDVPVLDHLKFKVRPQETTLVYADSGAGKSTVTNYLAVHLAHLLEPGEKVMIASLEVRPAVGLKVLACQLMGRRHLQDCTADRERVAQAMSWLNARFLFYNFTGIAQWRDLQSTFLYAAEYEGMKVAILDSVMRIGIADDDYTEQGLAAASLAQSTQDGKYHLIEVIHENKGDAKGKAKVRGSKQWTDNPDNVLQIRRNEDKGEKVDKIHFQLTQERASAQPDQEEIAKLEKELEKLRKAWDTNVILRKQRWMGSQQNGSVFCWFDRESFQLRTRWEDQSVNWLDKWKPRKEK